MKMNIKIILSIMVTLYILASFAEAVPDWRGKEPSSYVKRRQTSGVVNTWRSPLCFRVRERKLLAIKELRTNLRRNEKREKQKIEGLLKSMDETIAMVTREMLKSRLEKAEREWKQLQAQLVRGHRPQLSSLVILAPPSAVALVSAAAKAPPPLSQGEDKRDEDRKVMENPVFHKVGVPNPDVRSKKAKTLSALRVELKEKMLQLAVLSQECEQVFRADGLDLTAAAVGNLAGGQVVPARAHLARPERRFPVVLREGLIVNANMAAAAALPNPGAAKGK